MEFHTSDVSIFTGNMIYPIGTSAITRIFAFKLFNVSTVLPTVKVQNTIKYYL